MSKYFEGLEGLSASQTAGEYERLFSLWLEEILGTKPSSNPSLKWLYQSGLYDAAKDGSVVRQGSVQW